MHQRVQAAVAILVAAFVSACASAPKVVTAPRSEREGAHIIDEAQKIVTPEGIQKLETVQLGGIPQWISIRGHNKANPILLFLHGGPGFTMMPASYLYQSNWEEYFTVVQWDQRGAGKTFGANDPKVIGPTMNIDRMVADAEELITYLRTTYHQPKIIIMGHSWGTILGTKLALRHPDWFYAYVGVGQAVDVAKSEKMGYETLLEKAATTGNTEALQELRNLAPYPDPSGSTQKLEIQRKWLVYFGGYSYRKLDDHYGDIVELSPAYTDRDVDAFGAGIEFSLKALWSQIADLSFLNETEFKCPVLFFQGRDDLTTPSKLVAQWYETLRAPVKKLIWFDHSSHMVIEEEPGRVFVHLVEDVLPLTRAEHAPSH